VLPHPLSEFLGDPHGEVHGHARTPTYRGSRNIKAFAFINRGEVEYLFPIDDRSLYAAIPF
jgi:hypothetical protein